MNETLLSCCGCLCTCRCVCVCVCGFTNTITEKKEKEKSCISKRSFFLWMAAWLATTTTLLYLVVSDERQMLMKPQLATEFKHRLQANCITVLATATAMHTSIAPKALPALPSLPLFCGYSMSALSLVSHKTIYPCTYIQIYCKQIHCAP